MYAQIFYFSPQITELYNNLSDIQADLQQGKTTAKQLVEAYLLQIKLHSHLNAFLEVFDDEALAHAAELDAKIKSGQATGKLVGMVIAIKDNICYKGHKVSASSKILEGFTSIYSSTVIERLLAAPIATSLPWAALTKHRTMAL